MYIFFLLEFLLCELVVVATVVVAGAIVDDFSDGIDRFSSTINICITPIVQITLKTSSFTSTSNI